MHFFWTWSIKFAIFLNSKLTKLAIFSQQQISWFFHSRSKKFDNFQAWSKKLKIFLCSINDILWFFCALLINFAIFHVWSMKFAILLSLSCKICYFSAPNPQNLWFFLPSLIDKICYILCPIYEICNVFANNEQYSRFLCTLQKLRIFRVWLTKFMIFHP